MSQMKELYTELQEAGWKEEDIKTVSDKLFMIKRQEETEDEYMEQEAIEEQEEQVRNEPEGEGV